MHLAFSFWFILSGYQTRNIFHITLNEVGEHAKACLAQNHPESESLLFAICFFLCLPKLSLTECLYLLLDHMRPILWLLLDCMRPIEAPLASLFLCKSSHNIICDSLAWSPKTFQDCTLDWSVNQVLQFTSGSVTFKEDWHSKQTPKSFQAAVNK